MSPLLINTQKYCWQYLTLSALQFDKNQPMFMLEPAYRLDLRLWLGDITWQQQETLRMHVIRIPALTLYNITNLQSWPCGLFLHESEIFMKSGQNEATKPTICCVGSFLPRITTVRYCSLPRKVQLLLWLSMLADLWTGIPCQERFWVCNLSLASYTVLKRFWRMSVIARVLDDISSYSATHAMQRS